MPTVTVQVSDELKKRMESKDTVNWSAVARRAFEEEFTFIDELERFRELTKHSTMTEKDATDLGRAIRKAASERLRKLSGKTK